MKSPKLYFLSNSRKCGRSVWVLTKRGTNLERFNISHARRQRSKQWSPELAKSIVSLPYTYVCDNYQNQWRLPSQEEWARQLFYNSVLQVFLSSSQSYIAVCCRLLSLSNNRTKDIFGKTMTINLTPTGFDVARCQVQQSN